MKFTLEIELGNDAMRDWADVADALGQVQDRIDTTRTGTVPDRDSGFICDLNGNTVGSWAVMP